MIKNPPANAGDIRDSGLIPGSGRCPAEGKGNLLQYSGLGIPMDREAWHESDIAERLSMHTHAE